MTAKSLRRRRSGAETSPQDGEVYFEFQIIGASVKVAAVDAASGVEVAIVGPASAPRRALEKVALSKLEYALKRR